MVSNFELSNCLYLIEQVARNMLKLRDNCVREAIFLNFSSHINKLQLNQLFIHRTI